MQESLASSGRADCLASDGGWSAIIHAPSIQDEEAWVVELLAREHVLAHPGYFFDLEGSGHLVVSLLPPPEIFCAAMTRVLARLG